MLRGLVAAGHEIGQTYPRELERAWEHLDAQAAVLSEIVDAPVRSICQHSPWEAARTCSRATAATSIRTIPTTTATSRT